MDVAVCWEENPNYLAFGLNKQFLQQTKTNINWVQLSKSPCYIFHFFVVIVVYVRYGVHVWFFILLAIFFFQSINLHCFFLFPYAISDRAIASLHLLWMLHKCIRFACILAKSSVQFCLCIDCNFHWIRHLFFIRFIPLRFSITSKNWTFLSWHNTIFTGRIMQFRA